MNDEQYENLVKRLETFAAEKPDSYRFRVMMLAGLGYAYLYFIVAAVLAVCVGMIAAVSFGYVRINFLTIKVGWIPLVILFLVLRALWFRLPAPAGIELKETDAPKLFETVKDLSKKLDCPEPDVVLADGDFNASMARIPRLGIFGWNKSYLTVGLPLMAALSPEQFRAVLAHEMGHLSGNHGKMTAWIYRVRLSWLRVLMEMEHSRQNSESFIGQIASGIGNFVLSAFFKWYAPFFSAYSFVLARGQEYEADRAAVQLVNSKNLGEALISLEVKSQFLEREFWSKLLSQVNKAPEPPANAFSQMFATLRENSNPDNEKEALTLAMMVKSSYEEIHPCLSDRLAAIGHFKADEPTQLPPLPMAVTETAAQYFFGESADKLIERFNRQWQAEAGPQWRDRHRQVQNLRRRLHELETRAAQKPLHDLEFLERIELTDELEGSEFAVPLLREFLERLPDNAKANFMLGCILLSQKNEDGISHIEKAIESNRVLTLQGCQYIYLFLAQQGRIEETEKYRERAKQYYESLSEQEREEISG